MPLHNGTRTVPDFIRDDRADRDCNRFDIKSNRPPKTRSSRLRFKTKKNETSSKSSRNTGKTWSAVPQQSRAKVDSLWPDHGEADADAEPLRVNYGAMEFSGCRIIHYSSRPHPKHQQYSVQSQSDPEKFYSVDMINGPHCTCRSFARRQRAALAAFDTAHPCKHILYIKMAIARNHVIIEHGFDDNDDDGLESFRPCSNQGWRDILENWRRQQRDHPNHGSIPTSDHKKPAQNRKRRQDTQMYDEEISEHEMSEPEQDEGDSRIPRGAQYFSTSGWHGFDPNFFQRKRQRESAEKKGQSKHEKYRQGAHHTSRPQPSRHSDKSSALNSFDACLKAWENLEGKDSCRAADLPWPTDRELNSFFAGIDRVQAKKRYRKLVMLMGHPDKFLQRYGRKIPDSELEIVLPKVTLLSQKLNAMIQH